MKAILTAVIGIAAIYFNTYMILRARNETVVNHPMLIMPEKGIWKDRYVNETRIRFPSAGVQRPLNHLLYWVYYPAGQADRMLTGKCFRGVDDRNRIEMP